MAHLDYREKGGYDRLTTSIHLDSQTVPGVTYYANQHNPNFLGPASHEDIARQISGARGPSGTNSDYVLSLATALREMGVNDPHVFEIEALLQI